MDFAACHIIPTTNHSSNFLNVVLEYNYYTELVDFLVHSGVRFLSQKCHRNTYFFVHDSTTSGAIHVQTVKLLPARKPICISRHIQIFTLFCQADQYFHSCFVQLLLKLSVIKLPYNGHALLCHKFSIAWNRSQIFSCGLFLLQKQNLRKWFDSIGSTLNT